MSRMEFMRELEGLLSDIPLEERNEAIKYYNDYFEDAGEDHEEEIIKELVSPSRVAGIIKADLNLSGEEHENRGYFTEKGYQDTVYTDEKYEIIKTPKPVADENANQESASGQTGSRAQSSAGAGNRYSYGSAQSQEWNNQTGNQSGNNQGNQGTAGSGQTRTNNTNVALLILLAIFAIPIGIPMVFAIFGTLFGLICAVFGIVIGFGAAGVAMVATGGALFIIGIVQINVPYALLVLCGLGLVIFGLGVLFLLSSIMICKKLIPAMIRGIVSLCRLPFKNRSVAA